MAALLEGIADGTIGILCSDHAPHAQFEKEVEFDAAPFGIVGLETELGLFLDLLVHKNQTINLPRLIEMYTVNPARLLKIEAGTLSPGRTADVTLIDPELEWTFDASASQSLSRNTPFNGWKMKGRAVRTIVAWENGLGVVAVLSGRKRGCSLPNARFPDGHVSGFPELCPLIRRPFANPPLRLIQSIRNNRPKCNSRDGRSSPIGWR